MRELVANQLPAGVAASPDDVEDLRLPVGRRRGAHRAPGDVAVDRVRRLRLRPQVDEQEVAALDEGALLGGGLVVGIGGVGVDADVGIALRPQAGTVEGLEDELLDVELADRRAGLQARADEREGLLDDAMQVNLGVAMTVELRRAPDRDEALHEIGGGNQLAAERTQQLGGSGVEARHRGELVVGAVLATQAAGTTHQLGDAVAIALPGEVGALAARQVIEHRRLELVDQLARLTGARDQVVVAAGDQLVARGQAEHVEADRVVVLEDEKEPAVEVGFGEGGLDLGNAIGEHARGLPNWRARCDGSGGAW